ncbi:hypothetical protein ACFW04_006606 [Cataglyphis niger]
MSEIFSIAGEPIFDDRIKIETHTYNPYVNITFGNSDEIQIFIQQNLYTLPCESFLCGEGRLKYEFLYTQDLYTLPCESFLYIKDRLESKKPSGAEGESSTRLVNNCAAFMFEEIRYELDGMEIDRSRNVGITSTIKNYASLMDFAAKSHAIDDFNFCVPLSVLLGFCEDYKRVVINARHELILIRARNDYNCLVSHESHEPKIVLLKIQWRMPLVVLNDINKLALLRILDSERYLSVAFRSWDLYEFPLLQSMTKYSWAVKAATQLEKPRYVIFALQSGRKNVLPQDPSIFDNCKLTNVKLKFREANILISTRNEDGHADLRRPPRFYC